MIVTLTPNPGIDRTYALDGLLPGEVHRSAQDWVEAGGKGVNIARVLTAHGVPSRAVLPAGGPTGDAVLRLLEASGVDAVGVPVDGDLRCNITLTDPSGLVTKVNAAGPVLSAEELDRLVERTVHEVADAVRIADAPLWFVGCGSLTPEAPDDLFARLIERLRADLGDRVRIAIDTSGPALDRAVRCGPDVIKPNLAELEELCARPLATFRDVVESAREVLRDGVGEVLVSLGTEGALLVTADTVHHAQAPVVASGTTTTVGAGDAFLAGYLSRSADGSAEALRVAVAFGAAAVRRPIGAVAGPSAIDVPSVILTEGFESSRPSRAGASAGAAQDGAASAVSLGDRRPLGERA